MLRSERRDVLLLGVGPSLVQLWNHFGVVKQLRERLPNYAIEPIGAHGSRFAFGRSAASQWLSPFALVVEVLILFAFARLAKGDHRQITFAAFDQSAKQVAS